MKRIRKSAEPVELATWRDAIRPRGSIPPWDDFGDPARQAVRFRLAADQVQLCCYCAATIRNGGFHIEHWKPRDSYSILTYDWANLLASCQSYRHDNVAGEIVETQRHCGEAKDNWYEDGVTVNPQHRDVEAWFRFPLSGRIAAAKDLPAERFAHVETTISRLNLNAPSLIARRRALLTQAAQDAASMRRAAWLDRYLRPQTGATMQEFWPALAYNYRKHWSGLVEP